MSNSIAVVILDTLRYDSFGEYFDWLPGKRYLNAYSTSHWTNPSHASLFTGYYPSETGVHAKSRSLNCKQRIISEDLNKEGYTTRFWTANLHIYQWPNWDRGWDETVGPFSLEPTPEYLFDWSSAVREIEADGIELYLKSIYRCLQSDSPTIPSLYHGFREFKKNKQQDSGAKSIHNRVQSTTFGDKEFLVINFMDAHTPYFPPKDYSSFREPVNVTIGDGFAKANINQSRIKKAYDESVKYLSDIYYDVFNDLRSDFDYIITLSDHGELLGEHGMWNHGYGLYPELAHIPLTIFGDGFDGIEDSPVSILDVHKTIGELTNVSVDSRGQSLNTTKFEPQPRLTEYHGFLPGHEEQFERKKISREIFDIHDIILRGVVDSEARYGYETPEGFIGAQHLEKLLEELIEELSIKNIDESDEVELSDEIKDHLKDLGYA